MNTNSHHRQDDREPRAAVFDAEVAYYFPDPADVFEDCLAELLGFYRPAGSSNTEWRAARRRFLGEREVESNRLVSTAAVLAEETINIRALEWPY